MDSQEPSSSPPPPPLLFPTLATAFMFGFSPHGIYPMTSIWSTKLPEFHVFDERLKRLVEDDSTLRMKYLHLRNTHLLIQRSLYCQEHRITIAQFRYLSSLIHDDSYPPHYAAYYYTLSHDDRSHVETVLSNTLGAQWWFKFPIWECVEDIIDNGDLLFTYQDPDNYYDEDTTTTSETDTPSQQQQQQQQQLLAVMSPTTPSHEDITTLTYKDRPKPLAMVSTSSISTCYACVSDSQHQQAEDTAANDGDAPFSKRPSVPVCYTIDSSQRIAMYDMENELLMQLNLPRFEEITITPSISASESSSSSSSSCTLTFTPTMELPAALTAFRKKYPHYFTASDQVMKQHHQSLSLKATATAATCSTTREIYRLYHRQHTITNDNNNTDNSDHHTCDDDDGDNKHTQRQHHDNNDKQELVSCLQQQLIEHHQQQQDTIQSAKPFHTRILSMIAKWLNLPRYCKIYLPSQVDTFAASVIPFTPALREVFLWTGGRDVSREGIMCSATQNRSVLLVPGGQREMPYSSHKDFNFVLYTRHQGFIRMALRCGMPLVPIFSFGENQVVSTFQFPEIQMYIYKKTRIYFPIFPHGPFYSMAPNRVPITIAVGQPIFMPVIENPSQEIVKFYHGLYYMAIAKLFFRYRAAAGLPTSTLTFI